MMSTNLSSSGVRAVLFCSVALVAASCTTDEYVDPTADENAFLQRGAPRYGAGGTQSPSQNPGRYRVGEPIPPGEYSRGRRGTVFLDDRKEQPPQPERKRGFLNRNRPDEQPPARVVQREDIRPIERAKPKVKTEPKPKSKPKLKSNELDPNSVVQAPEIEKPKPKAAPKPSPKPEVSSSQPTATPVPGQPGMVYSPFDAQKRKVNVDGFPSGSEARCPYTKKIFRVP